MAEATIKRWKALGPVAAAAIGILIIVGYWYLRSPESTKVKAGMMAPDLELPANVYGTKARLSSFRGRPVLLVFFMATCELCQAEIPQIERLFREFRTRGFMVLGVSVDADYATRERFVREQQITFPILQDPDGVAVREAYGSYKMPEAYLIDPRGRVDSVYLGQVRQRRIDVRERILKMLSASAASGAPPARTPAPSTATSAGAGGG